MKIADNPMMACQALAHHSEVVDMLLETIARVVKKASHHAVVVVDSVAVDVDAVDSVVVEICAVVTCQVEDHHSDHTDQDHHSSNMTIELMTMVA